MQHPFGIGQQTGLTPVDVLADLILELGHIDQRLTQGRGSAFPVIQLDRRRRCQNRGRVAAILFATARAHMPEQGVFQVVLDQQQGRCQLHPARVSCI